MEDDTDKRDMTGGMFEESFVVSAEEAGEFLVELGEQLRDSDEVTVEGDDWKVPFAFGDRAEIEVEYDGNDPELEVEVELEGRTPEDEAPDIS
jgi:amphi-Trp domain-containing protein